MNELNIISEMGHHADLLTRSDSWLESQRRFIASNMTDLADELDAVLKAQRIKRRLQQHNMVAVQEIRERPNGQIEDISIKVKSMPDAVASLRKQPNSTISQVNIAAQLIGWESDGYDIATSAALR